MIQVTVKKNRVIQNVVIEGHSEYAECGNDIVCAAVSATTLTTVGAILSLEESICFEESDGYLRIDVISQTDINQRILQNMLDLLKQLHKQYPNYIKIYKEV